MSRRLRAIGLTAVCALVAGSTTAVAAEAGGNADAVVQIDTGKVRGSMNPQAGTRTFQGIPYAAPPVGEFRWAPPAPAKPWQGVRDATKPGSTCPQKAGITNRFSSTNEDCLFLNVTTPSNPTTTGDLPVMVWIHGGSMRTGAGSKYGAAKLVTQGDSPVIVVTLNYRLGALGYLPHEALRSGGESGNWGYMDQQAALKWVQRNIAAFGGDPGRVTIFGESAGGQSVCTQMAVPSSNGLYRAAIMQSGPCMAGQAQAAAETQGAEYAAKLGCGDAATTADCLRKLPVTTLLDNPDYGSPATHGGKFLPESPLTGALTGKLNKVPLISGTTHDEGALFIYGEYGIPGVSRELTAEEYPAAVAKYQPQLSPAEVDLVVKKYPVEKYSQPAVALRDVWTDSAVCALPLLHGAFSRSMPTYAYQFDDRAAPAPPSLFPMGAYHASELQYIFDMDPSTLPLEDLNGGQRLLSRDMVRYWTEFAISGKPHPTGLPPMPEFNSATQTILSLDVGGSRPISDFNVQHQCGFWLPLIVKGLGSKNVTSTLPAQ